MTWFYPAVVTAGVNQCVDVNSFTEKVFVYLLVLLIKSFKRPRCQKQNPTVTRTME